LEYSLVAQYGVSHSFKMIIDLGNFLDWPEFWTIFLYILKTDTVFGCKEFYFKLIFAAIYSYSKLGLIHNVKEFINITGLLLSRKTGVGSLRFCVVLSPSVRRKFKSNSNTLTFQNR
jgi:hypothetical protein